MSKEDVRVRPLHVIYLLCHLMVLVVGLFMMESGRALVQAVGASLVASGIAGGVIFTYVLWSTQLANTLAELERFGLTRIFEARSVRIRDAYEQHLQRLAKEIDVLGFGLRAFREDYRDRFPQWTKAAVVRVLLLDPEFPSTAVSLADQRDREEKNASNTIQQDVRAFVQDISALQRSSGGRFRVKLYRCLPSVNILRIDDALFWGPYLLGDQSRNMPTLKVQEGGILFTRLLEHFDRIWTSKDFCREVPKEWMKHSA